jgi:hypothetical protein
MRTGIDNARKDSAGEEWFTNIQDAEAAPRKVSQKGSTSRAVLRFSHCTDCI